MTRRRTIAFAALNSYFVAMLLVLCPLQGEARSRATTSKEHHATTSPRTPTSSLVEEPWIFQASNGYVVTVDQSRPNEGDLGSFSVQHEGELFSISMHQQSATAYSATISDSSGAVAVVAYTVSHSGGTHVTYIHTTYGVNTAGNAPITTEAQLLDNATNGHYALLRSALLSTHSASFYESMGAALAEAEAEWPQSLSGLQCGLAIIRYVASIPVLATCATVILCVLGIGLHYASIASMVCSCTEDTCP